MHPVFALLAAIPVFTAGRVLPSNYDRPSPLAPGMLMSIYGDNLGPQQGCTGYADTRKLEPANPHAPLQMFVNKLIYPKTLCGVQVFVGDKAAGLLWVQAGQINFKVPQDVPLEGSAPLRVVYNSAASQPVAVPLGLQAAELRFEGPLTTLGPVWVEVLAPPGTVPALMYPFRFGPQDFGCHVFEVRRNGVRLSPRAPNPVAGGVSSGPLCGSMALPAPEPSRNRIPLHLAYRFDQPGTYEVRYSYAPEYPRGTAPIPLSGWTRLEIRPWTQTERTRWMQRLRPPGDANLLLTRYIPSILGFPDAAGLDRLLPLLYHSNELVRRFAQAGLGYWPKDQMDAALQRSIRDRGPSDVAVDLALPSLKVSDLAPFLLSKDPVLLRGALRGLQGLLYWSRPPISAEQRAEAGSALIAAHDHILATTDQQTQANYAAALGGVRDARAGNLLWDMAKDGRSNREQALIAITWRKNPSDLPRLTAIMTRPDGIVGNLPNALRAQYGDASLPYLEKALAESPAVRVRTECARELILARRASGFAFAWDALENDRTYKGEMRQFLRDQFPELRNLDDAAVREWLKQRAR